ncbi:hypothetical protein [Novipirellula artificiosorum]|uniref:Uncharacterized protein n=1 Tax=Novipirellula artificiosorum TaxID=2528016 RepID=A0A5C6E0U3_9BACT|nr:hypothetical protein [Novipirellula artificiosorum]TWU40789.1 hypothetical protein Poly41_16240 [Novipirellula artificiosorum]
MYQLPCPHCDAVLDVSPSRAGEQRTCPSCHQSVQIPKLGELRQLPEVNTDAADVGIATHYDETGLAPRMGMVVLGLIATAALLTAGYCGIRWALVDVPYSTETHLAEVHEKYPKLKAAELIREYEQMEDLGLDLPNPYPYKLQELEKRGWGRNAAIAAAISFFSTLGAFFLGTSGRSRPKDA